METRSVWLVRHGQASFGKSDYDNLSEAGHEQAYLLGKDFARRGITPSLLVSGSMKRHRQTLAEIAAGAWSALRATGPAAEHLIGWGVPGVRVLTGGMLAWREQVLRCALGDLTESLRTAGITKTAVIIIGDVLAAEGFTDSYLYSTGRRRGSRH